MMEFLTLLIVLGLLQVWGSGGPVQKDDWYVKWESWVGEKISSTEFKLGIVVAGPCLLVAIFQSWFESVLFGLFSLALYVGALLFSLGRGDFNENLRQYLMSWSHGNVESAYEKATHIGDFRCSEAISDPESLHEKVREAVIYEGYQRWFAVIFWFLLLGPAACIAYRLCYLAGRQENTSVEDQQFALTVTHYLDWIPARLLAFSFTLTGNFVHGFNRCWQSGVDNMPIPELLNKCALAAISGFHELSTCPSDRELFMDYARTQMLAVQSLLSRSVVCWLVVIAVMQFV